MIDIGILAKCGEYISFRFRCYQEYFFARAILEDPELFSYVNRVEHMHLYAREIDLLTALTRRSLGFTDTVVTWVEKTRPMIPTDTKSVELSTAILGGTGHVGLSSERRKAVRKEPMSDEQVDLFLEKAEKFAIERREERQRTIHLDSNAQQQNSFFRGEHPLAVETLGRIIRNAEFDDSDYKMPALCIFIDSSQAIIDRMLTMIDELIEVFRVRHEEFSLPITSIDMDNIFNSLRVRIPAVFAGQLTEQVGSEKLVPTINKVYNEYTGKFGPQFFLVSLLLDLGVADATRKMLDLARLNHRPLPLHLIHEKLSINYTLRRFREETKEELENAIADVGVMLGESPKSKGRRLTEIRRSAHMRDL